MVKLRLLGAIELDSPDGRHPSVLRQPKHVAILAYLALATPRGYHRRDKLLSLFWPESDEARARGALNQALYRLRQSLGDGFVLARGTEEVGLDWTQWWCDAAELRAASAAGHYAAVVDLYRGDLLSGFHADTSAEFEQWLDGERRAAREAAGAAVIHMANAAEASGDVTAAVSWLRKAQSIRPFEESSLQRLMELLDRSGDGQTALLEYEMHVARLAAELEAQPARPTMLLAARIRDSIAVTSSSEIVLRPSKTAAAPAQDALVPEAIPARRAPLVATTMASVLLMAGGTFVVRDFIADVPDTSRHIVIADLENRTNEPHLAAAVTEALSIDFSQSDVIRTASKHQVGLVLKRMGRDTTSVLTEALAREVALREGLKAVLRGEVAALGSGYLISAQLITADSGRVLVAAREEATRAQDIIPAVDRLSERLRKRMGESLRAARASQPLAAVTTHSLEALKLYSAGLRLVRYADAGDGRTSGGLPGRVRADDRAVTLFEQAIALDSSFASAYRALGVHLYWFGQNERVKELLTRAFQLRHQLTERERLQTEGTYSHFVLGDYDRAIACFEQLLDRDANDIVAIQHLGYMYFRRRDFLRAVEMYERDWAMRGGTPAMLYTSALLGAGRVDRADSVLQHFARLDSTGGLWHGELLRVKAGRGDFAAVDTLLPRMLTQAGKSGSHVRFQAAVFAGRWKIWRGRYTEGMELLNSALGPGGLFSEIKTAQQELYVLRDSTRARRRLDAAVAKMPPDELPPADRPYVFLANIYAHAGDHKRAAAFMQAARSVQRPPSAWAAVGHERAIFSSVEALGSAAAGDIQGARRIVAAAERETGCWYGSQERHLLRARVEEIAGHPDSAIAALERLVAAPECGLALSWSDVWAPHTQAYGHERLAELYYARRDTKRAALHYTHFVQLWPDPDHPQLRARWQVARRRLAELASVE